MDIRKFAHPPATGTRRTRSAMPLLLAFAGGLALFATWQSAQASQKARRFSDHAQERRNPLSLFIAGPHPRRREIDRSGGHPLFERRQSVYEAY